MNTYLSLLTSASLNRHEDMQSIFACLAHRLPPGQRFRVGNYEPLSEELDLVHYGRSAHLWTDPLFAESIRGDIFLSIFMASPRQRHGWIQAAFCDPMHEQLDLESLLIELATTLSPVFGLVHRPGQAELRDEERAESLHWLNAEEYTLGVDPFLIRRHVPNLYWGSVFGPPYCGALGTERFLSTPADNASLVSPATVYIRLTPSVCDAADDPVAFKRSQTAAKAHINSLLFFDPSSDQARFVPNELLG